MPEAVAKGGSTAKSRGGQAWQAVGAKPGRGQYWRSAWKEVPTAAHLAREWSLATTTASARSEGQCWAGRCDDAKERLVAQRAQLQEPQVAAVAEALRGKPASLPDSLLESGLAVALIDDLRCVLQHDRWDGRPWPGTQWLNEWLSEGKNWAEQASLALQCTGAGLRCNLCCREFSSDWGLSQHVQCKEHHKQVQNWVWKFGRRPDAGSLLTTVTVAQAVPASTSAVDAEGLPLEACSEEDEAKAGSSGAQAVGSRDVVAIGAGSRAKVTVAKLLAQARAAAEAPSAIAKRELLRYRDGLSEEERGAVLMRIGLPRANDVPGLPALRDVFAEDVYSWMCQVENEDWLWKEPTFSWLSGFYWHPESTRLHRGGPPHSGRYCHLCEVEYYDEAGQQLHEAGRRHAETFDRWVERMGATPVPEACSRCPRHDEPPGECPGGGDAPMALEIDCLRPEGALDVDVPEECEPPVGFATVWEVRPAERPESIPYAAFVVRPTPPPKAKSAKSRGPGGRGKAIVETPARVRVASSRLRIGSRVGKRRQGASRWGVDLQAPLRSTASLPAWRSLAIPLREKAASVQGRLLDFAILLDEGEDVGNLQVTVPPNGFVAVVTVELPAQRAGTWASSTWLQPVDICVVPLAEFVASGQVAALGGVQALRGEQRGFQLATEELMMSFLLHLPTAQDPAPVLVFFHGDMQRDGSHCPMPGLADFCTEYGPAELCSSKRVKDSRHAVRSFIVVTPCSPAEYWWFRHPAVHDAGGYVPAVERWFRRLTAWLEVDLGVSLPSTAGSRAGTGPCGGLRLAGQSMGGYAALELARAMPEKTAAVAVGAPCFDAARLNWLASRIANVPLWVLIGRNDTMCAFEELASLVLKLRDRGTCCARLTSYGIKGHNEACKLLDKSWLYRWLQEPRGPV